MNKLQIRTLFGKSIRPNIPTRTGSRSQHSLRSRPNTKEKFTIPCSKGHHRDRKRRLVVIKMNKPNGFVVNGV